MKELPEKLTQLLTLLKKTTDDEIDCDEFWEKAAYLAEVDLSLDLDELKDYLQHLELCPGCAEELALLKKCASDDSNSED